MYHSITFGDKNTWDDWRLVPETRPVVNPPEPKVSVIDIPGSDGVLDLTNALSKYTNFSNRTGSIDFIVVNDFYYPVDDERQWYAVYSDILNYLHGQKMKMILEDDLQYYYEGRFSVNEWKSDKNFSRITIDYDVGPYKWNIFSSTDDWLWDPFNFETSLIPTDEYRDIPIDSWTFDETTMKIEYNWHTIVIDPNILGEAPVSPIFKATFDHPAPMMRRGENMNVSGLMFAIPGFDEPRYYSYHELKNGVTIPEFSFRKTMEPEELTIECATMFTRGIFGTTKCPICQADLIYANIVRFADQHVLYNCTSCHSSSILPYSPDTATLSLELREGRL